MIPIRDERGRIAGFGARALEDDQMPKYLNSPQTALFDKGRLLYGLDRARKPIRAWLKKLGKQPAAVADHRALLNRFYDCDATMQKALADMYVADDRFRASYEEHAEGLAQYVRDAVHQHADAI